MRDQKSEVRDKIQETQDLDEASMAAVTAAIGEFQKQYHQKGAATTARV
jgi:hypothetical protein